MIRILILLIPGVLQGYPSDLVDFIQKEHRLPRYEEVLVAPVGRNPVIDAVLAKPAYLARYGYETSQRLRQSEALDALIQNAWSSGGVSFEAATPQEIEPPEAFKRVFGEQGARLYRAWHFFLFLRQSVFNELNKLSEEEQKWLFEEPERFFFNGGDEYQFLTSNSPIPWRVFQLSEKLDMAIFARASHGLAQIVEEVRTMELRPFEWEEKGARLVISGGTSDRHTEAIDFFIDLGGNDLYRRERSAFELVIDKEGDDVYSKAASGVLGVSVWADFQGNDLYEPGNYTQAAAFFGSAALFDLSGDDVYEGGFFCQGAATFGTALLFDGQGHDQFHAEGFAQAAASTRGVAFLADGNGDDLYWLGEGHKGGWTRTAGIGQGGSVGMRFDPWIANPSFYGGVAFLDDGGGNDRFAAPMFAQGSSYFLSLGILVNSGGDDQYHVAVDGLGQGLHLTAGLFLKEGGDDDYYGGWGSIGVSGDRSVGLFIDTGGSDSYKTDSHGIGSSRKPKSWGMFLDLAGDDQYEVGELSQAVVERPIRPDTWPKALFADLGGEDQYDGARKNDQAWRFEKGGIGIDENLKGASLQTLLTFLPKKPETYDAERLLIRFLQGDESELPSILRGEKGEAPMATALLWAVSTGNSTFPADPRKIESAYVRKLLTAYLGYHFYGRGRESLQELLRSDPDEAVRASSAFHLSRKATTLEDIEVALADSTFVQYRCLTALLDTKLDVSQVVIPKLSSSDLYVRRAAALVLISRSYKPAIAVLLASMRTRTLDTTDNYGDNLFNTLARYVGVNHGTDLNKWVRWWADAEESFIFPKSERN